MKGDNEGQTATQAARDWVRWLRLREGDEVTLNPAAVVDLRVTLQRLAGDA